MTWKDIKQIAGYGILLSLIFGPLLGWLGPKLGLSGGVAGGIVGGIAGGGSVLLANYRNRKALAKAQAKAANEKTD